MCNNKSEGVDPAACELPAAPDHRSAVIGWRVINLPSFWVTDVPPGCVPLATVQGTGGSVPAACQNSPAPGA